MAASTLARRVATAAVLVPAVLAALFLLPTTAWALVVLGIVLIGALEWARLCALGRAASLAFVLVVAVLGLALLALLGQGSAGFADAAVYVVCGLAGIFWIAIAPRWLAAGWPVAQAPAALAVGAIVLLATWVALVELQARSPWLVLAAMAIVWIADTAAYFAGRRFGKRKLAPSISPGKTWEGVYGALAAVAVYGLVLVLAGFPATLAPLGGIAFIAGLMVLAAVSVVGDLFESLMKRQAGVKDSGSLLPGHGGVLDRVDALLAAMPLAALAVTAWLATGSAA
jgi:phosphatidate cytidylyltransferase